MGVRRKMRPCQAVPLLLLLLLLGSARATTPGPRGLSTLLGPRGLSTTPAPGAGTVPPGPWLVTYREVVESAAELLSTRGLSPYVLRPLETGAQPGRPLDLRGRQELSFVLEETTCRAPGPGTAACRGRWLGAVTRCQGWVFLEQQQPTVELSCEKVPTLFPRLRTARLRDIFTRIKERFRGFFQCSKIWIRDKLKLQTPKP